MKFERSLQISIIRSNDFGFLDFDLKGLEEGPVFDVMAILRAVVDSRKAAIKNNPGYELRQNPWSGLLQDRRVELLESELLQMNGQ